MYGLVLLVVEQHLGQSTHSSLLVLPLEPTVEHPMNSLAVASCIALELIKLRPVELQPVPYGFPFGSNILRKPHELVPLYHPA